MRRGNGSAMSSPPIEQSEHKRFDLISIIRLEKFEVLYGKIVCFNLDKKVWLLVTFSTTGLNALEKMFFELSISEMEEYDIFGLISILRL